MEHSYGDNFVQDILDACSATATESGASTLLIGSHRQGHAIALSASGLEVGGGETAYTFRPVNVKEEFLVFMSDTLAITAASQETMTMMGVRLCRVKLFFWGG
jgi:hypothetical protein